MPLASDAIALFDSGIGGLTVMQQLMHDFPHERFIYFGDTARVPYGNKSPQTIIRYSIENTIHLLEKQIKLLVVACNTASALALPKLRQLFNIPIIGVIESGAEKAVKTSISQKIAVLGTRSTIQSDAYQQAISKLSPNATIFPIACPLFVSLAEERWLEHPSTQLIIKEYLNPIKNQQIDTILLGCTHYPLLRPFIQKEFDDAVKIVDGASICSEKVFTVLKEKQLLSSRIEKPHEFYASDDPERFKSLGESLFKCSFEKVELLSTQN